jgi:hypothetical protein
VRFSGFLVSYVSVYSCGAASFICHVGLDMLKIILSKCSCTTAPFFWFHETFPNGFLGAHHGKRCTWVGSCATYNVTPRYGVLAGLQ